MNKYFEPDWDFNDYRISGGHIEDIPKPYVYYWPKAKNKRKLTVRIMRYTNVFAIHYHVSVREETNPLWDGRPSTQDLNVPRGWTIPWDKHGEFLGDGLTDMDLSDKMEKEQDYDYPFCYDTWFNAKQAIDNLCKIYFPNHEIVLEDYSGEAEERYADKHGE